MDKRQTDNPIVKVDFKEARIYGDLAAIVQDLKTVLQTCSKLETILDKSPDDTIIIEALWTSALIRYARCFAKGKRYDLTESIFENLQGDAVGAHKYYINLRNKHIAHSVNPFEQIEVGLILSPEETEKSVVGVTALSMRLICLNKEGVHDLGCLTKIALDKSCELGKEYEKIVLERGNKYPLNDLYKRGRPRLTAPGSEMAGRPRSENTSDE